MDRALTATLALAASVALLATPGAVSATSIRDKELTCPVTGKKFNAPVVMMTNGLGGADRDFLQLALGAQPLLVEVVTSPYSLYSGYPPDFDVQLTPAQKEELKKKLVPLVPIKADTKPADIPAWVRYDLAAQTYRILGRPREQVAQAYLCASWAVRLSGDDLCAALTPEDYEKVRGLLGRKPTKPLDPPANAADEEIKVGRQLAALLKLGKLGKDMQRLAGLVAINHLRRHGENTEAVALLPLLAKALPADELAKLGTSIKESVACERQFQMTAVDCFEKLLAEDAGLEQRAGVTYLCGELHRRLENWDKARKWFEAAATFKDKDLASWISEQTALLPPSTPRN